MVGRLGAPGALTGDDGLGEETGPGPEPPAPALGALGLNRSAAFGTTSVSSARATSNAMVAVMPGRSARSLLSTSMSVVYVTTFSTVVGLNRTCPTRPRNLRPGYASTTNSADMPSQM